MRDEKSAPGTATPIEPASLVGVKTLQLLSSAALITVTGCILSDAPPQDSSDEGTETGSQASTDPGGTSHAATQTSISGSGPGTSSSGGLGTDSAGLESSDSSAGPEEATTQGSELPARLIYAANSSYTDAEELDGAELPSAGNIWVRLETSDDLIVDHVTWEVDGSVFRDDDLDPPWDLTYMPDPFGLHELSGEGEHEFCARMFFEDGENETQCATVTTSASSASGIRWAPPVGWESYPMCSVDNEHTTFNLDSDEDCRLVFEEVVHRTVRVNGGRNVVVVGGEVQIDASIDSEANHRMTMRFFDQTGVIFIEGVWGHGSTITEGFQFSAPNAIAYIQNTRIEGLQGSNESGVNHADTIQPWGGLEHLYVYNHTGSSHYQGLMLKGDHGPLGGVTLDRVNLIGLENARYLLWKNGNYNLSINEVYAQPDGGWSFDKTMWPEPPDNTWNAVIEGAPPRGDFVPPGVAGMGYVSPGYP